MNDLFLNMFSDLPQNNENGVFFFDSDIDADHFDISDAKEWHSGRFYNSLNGIFFLNNTASRKLIENIANRNLPVVEIACGPGMGMMPSIKHLSPQLPCLVTDASSLVIREWKKYLDEHQMSGAFDLAQFSLMDIPFKNDCVTAYSSFIGLSSTRNGESGRRQALNEIFRTLVSGGYFYTIESEWADVDTILRVFEKLNQTPWPDFQTRQTSWHERFIDAGFEIVSKETVEYHKFTSDDNELGEAAELFGIEVGTINTAYILRKP